MISADSQIHTETDLQTQRKSLYLIIYTGAMASSRQQRLDFGRQEAIKAWSEGIGVCRLSRMCVEVACESKDSVQAWRRQKRTLERLPVHLANYLFHRLLHAGLLNAPMLELFQYCVEEVHVSGETSVNAEWTAYLKDFHYLRVFEASGCRSLSNFAISQLKGLKTLEELDVSSCPKITDEGLTNLLSLPNLKKLVLSGTKVTTKGLLGLANLKDIKALGLGGLSVTDSVILSLLTLTQLEHLDVWGSKVTDNGVTHLKGFHHLQYLNLAWTEVKQFPSVYSLKHLNMANCTISSLFDDREGSEGMLEELHLSGANILNSRVLIGVWATNLSVIDLSSSNIEEFDVLDGKMNLRALNLGGTTFSNSEISRIAEVGYNLKQLDLSGCKVDSEAIGILAGHVPKLQQIMLSGTSVDDSVFAYLQLMPSLERIDLSYTNINGFRREVDGRSSKTPSFVSIQQLQSLSTLNLRSILISDKACQGLSCLSGLTCLWLRSELLSDYSLGYFSVLKKLVTLGIEGAMLTDSGLLSFSIPPALKELSLRDCWLLSKKGLIQFQSAHRSIILIHSLLEDTTGSSHVSSANETRVSIPTLRSDISPIVADERIKYSKDALLKLRILEKQPIQDPKFNFLSNLMA